MHLTVILVGERLVHYKWYKMHPADYPAIPIALLSKVEFRKYLKTSKAVLISE